MVAIKLMSPEMASTSPARKWFLCAKRVAPPPAMKTSSIFTTSTSSRSPFSSWNTSPVAQRKLDDVGPLEVVEVLQIGQQIANGLAAAHSQGLIHRDVKPANILLEEGIKEQVKITDFGLARAADDASVTQSGIIVGTPLLCLPSKPRANAWISEPISSVWVACFT